MKASQIDRILTGLGYDTKTTIQASEIRAFILSTNQGMNSHEEFITLDQDVNVIGIKKYDYKVINGRISNNIRIEGNKIYSNGISLYLRHPMYTFRAPRIGDTVFVIKQDGTMKSSKSKIVNITTYFLELDNSLGDIDLKNDFIIYADSELFGKSVQDSKIPALYFVYRALSNNKQDIYLEGDGLVGIELYSAVLGSI